MAVNGSNNSEAVSHRRVPSWAWVMTVAWVILLVVATSLSKACPEAETLINPLPRFLSCRTPNELGDYLAGAFAPLAFLWLVVAVYIQSQELGAQRRELAFTRREFELNRSVAEETRKEIAAQAAAAKQNAEYVGRQTEILNHQLEQQRQRRNDDSASEMLDQLETYLRNRVWRSAKWRGAGGVRSILNASSYPVDRDDALVRMVSEFTSRISQVRTIPPEERRIDPHSAAILHGLRVIVHQISELRDNASLATIVLLDTIQLDEMQAGLEFLFSNSIDMDGTALSIPDW